MRRACSEQATRTATAEFAAITGKLEQEVRGTSAPRPLSRGERGLCDCPAGKAQRRLLLSAAPTLRYRPSERWWTSRNDAAIRSSISSTSTTRCSTTTASSKTCKDHLERVYGLASRVRYWKILEDLFDELGYRDYLGALQRYRVEHPRQVELLAMSSFLLDYPFAARLFPAALELLQRMRAGGPTVILSDGDVVFQPRKVDACGSVARGGRPGADLCPQGRRPG